MAEVPLRCQANPREVQWAASASPVEDLEVEHIHFLQVVGPKDCGTHVKVVVLEEVGKWARVPEVILEQRDEPRHVH